MSWIRDWAAREPVRLYMYSVVAAFVALAVALGVIDATVAPFILAAAAAVLGVPAVEIARSKVKPKDG